VKILIVVPYFDEPHRWMVSGQKTAYELAKHHTVIVLTTGSKSVVTRVDKNLKIYRLKDLFLRDPINYSLIPHLFYSVRTIVKQEQPDAFLINKHMFYSSLAVWPIKRLGHKVVVQTDTFPGINWFPKSKLIGVVMWLYARLIGNPILRAADTVILLHEGLVDEAKRLGLHYTVIHNGIDLKTFDAAPPPNELVKKRGEIWVGYVGRLESVKGWDNLAEVANEIVINDHRVHFFFIGPTKNAEEKIESFSHPRIHFLGLRNDVAGIDKLLDIFVMPSLSEGLSNAVMEAMAAQCCCLVSEVGGNKILIKNNHNGKLFKKGDKTDLKIQLMKLIGDPVTVKKLGAQARKSIENDFDLAQNAQKIARLLEPTAKIV
jgi:glycosyltransferase involved in cell wall biosynthesis